MAQLRSAYLIHGDDHGAIAERRARLRALAESDGGSASVQTLEGDAGSPAEVAAALAMPSARADVVIDANPTPEAIEAALARLLDRARERGSAIGVASASPMSVERLARWANGLDSMGVALVPLSALMSAAPSPSAQAKP